MKGLSSKTLLESGYGRTYKMDYYNYKTDPKPNVLMLGYWVHPNTGNKLLGGINLNYISQQQLTNLRKKLPKILGQKGLKARYRFGRRTLPDIFRFFYRTYNSEFVNVVQPSTLRYWNPKSDKRRDELENARKKREVQKAAQLQKAQEKGKETDQEAQRGQAGVAQSPDQMAGTSRNVWAKEKMIQNREGIPQEPDPEAVVQELGKDQDIRQQARPQKPVRPVPQQDHTHDLDALDSPDDVDISDDLFGPKEFGEAYVRGHLPDNYIKRIRFQRPDKVNAIYNIVTEQIILDHASHTLMMCEADWDYRDTLRLSYDEGVILNHNIDEEIAESHIDAILNTDDFQLFLELNDSHLV